MVREREGGSAWSRAQLKPASLDVGLLVWQQLPVPARSIHEMEQWEGTKQQSPGSPTRLLPLPPTPSGTHYKEKLFWKSSLAYPRRSFLLATCGRQPQLTANAKPQRRENAQLSSVIFFSLNWSTLTLKVSNYHAAHSFHELKTVSLELKMSWNAVLTSRMCSSCCSLSSFLEVVVTKPGKDNRQKQH